MSKCGLCARSTTHASDASASGSRTRLGAPEHIRALVETLGATDGVLNVALAFPDLLQARHQADYDHFGGFSKPAAVQHIEAAEAAIRAMRYQKRAKKQVLYALVAMEIKKVQ